MTIYRDKVEISTDEWSETRLPNWEQVLITNNPDKSMTWSSHWINVKVEWPDNGKYHLYTKDYSKLDLGMYWTDEAFCSIAKILSSKQNNPGEKCKVLDDHTIQCWDTSAEIQTADLEEITKWINNFN